MFGSARRQCTKSSNGIEPFVVVDIENIDHDLWMSMAFVIADYPSGEVRGIEEFYVDRTDHVITNSNIRDFWARHPEALAYNKMRGKGVSLEVAEACICKYICDLRANNPAFFIVSDNPGFDVRVLDGILITHGHPSLSQRTPDMYAQVLCTWSFRLALAEAFGVRSTDLFHHPNVLALLADSRNENKNMTTTTMHDAMTMTTTKIVKQEEEEEEDNTTLNSLNNNQNDITEDNQIVDSEVIKKTIMSVHAPQETLPAHTPMRDCCVILSRYFMCKDISAALARCAPKQTYPMTYRLYPIARQRSHQNPYNYQSLPKSVPTFKFPSSINDNNNPISGHQEYNLHACKYTETQEHGLITSMKSGVNERSNVISWRVGAAPWRSVRNQKHDEKVPRNTHTFTIFDPDQ